VWGVDDLEELAHSLDGARLEAREFFVEVFLNRSIKAASVPGNARDQHSSAAVNQQSIIVLWVLHYERCYYSLKILVANSPSGVSTFFCQRSLV
jgi:hypothetical protein